MEISPIQGIILKAITYEESTQFITVFSQEEGLITIAYKSRAKKNSRGLSPLLKIEVSVFAKGKDVWKGSDLHVLTSYPSLRKTIESLQGASTICAVLLKTLPTHLPLPELWSLLDEHFHDWENFIHPYTATCSFLAKFLSVEFFGAHEKLTPEDLLSNPSFKILPSNDIELFIELSQRNCSKTCSLTVEKSFLKKLLLLFQEAYKVDLSFIRI